MANPSDTAIRDHANVRIPPPLIYVAGFVIGLLIEIEFPISLLPLTARRVAAILCIAVSAILIVWSIRLFRRAGTTFIPIKPTTALVWSGPYQFTRNPMYLAMACLYLGLALWFDLFWPLILLPGVLAGVQYGVIAREEQYLERKFGDDYRRYKARVRRWL